MLELDGNTWASIYLGNTDMAGEIKSKKVKVTKGDKAELLALFDLFDTFDPTSNYKVPPMEN